MAELPNLGRHCGAELCNLLDFLPIRCDACSGTFCLSHYTYEGHDCQQAYRKNVQVPTCPLCDKPVPTPKGVSPDVQVDQHIQNNCAQGPKKKIFANRCTVKGCKKKELVPITCPSCHQNFCLGHRHEKDHNCSQTKGSPALSRAAAAALARNQGGQNCASQARNTQISEDEALARALAASMDDVNISPEERDRRLAEQLQAQEYGGNPIRQRNTRAASGNSNNCSIS
nr:Zinc finger domain containing protein [Haemonchus contortus]